MLVRVQEKPDRELEDLAKMLTDVALVGSGYQVNTAPDTTRRFFRLFRDILGISPEAQIEEVNVNLEEDDEEEIKKEEEKKKEEENRNNEEIHQENVQAHEHSHDEEESNVNAKVTDDL